MEPHVITTAAIIAATAFLFWAARMMLRSWPLAAIAAAPVVLAPVAGLGHGGFAAGHARGAVAAAALAGALAIWLRGHLSGRGTSRLTVTIVAFLCAAVAALDQGGLLAVAAFMLYLALYARGRWRVLKPLVVAAMVGAVYLALNPVTVIDLNAGPWNVSPATVVRRIHSLRRCIATGGPCSAVSLAAGAFFWWPLFPSLILAAWASRRQRWFPVTATLWSALAVGEALHLLGMSPERYTNPLHLGFYFLTAVCILSACRQFGRPGTDDTNGRADGPVGARAALPARPLGPTPGSGLYNSRLVGAVVAAALLAAVLATVTIQAKREEPLHFDEALWFMRSHALPSDLSTQDRVYWAIDVPGVNRWVYWGVLRSTGLDRVPPDEKSLWSVQDGKICVNGAPLSSCMTAFYYDRKTLEDWMSYAGEYAPRSAILAMRQADIAAFAIYLVLLWLAARVVLKSSHLSTAAVMPIALSPAAMIPFGFSFYAWSGDIFMLAAMAGALLAWLAFHRQGKGAGARAALVVGLLLGLAVAAKLHALLALWAYMAYAAYDSRGWRRVTLPLAAAAAALAVFVALNPVMVLHPEAWPWEVAGMFVARRADVVSRYRASFGPAPLSQILMESFYWWPVLPAACAAAWACRRERWFAPVFVFALFAAGGTAAGFVQTRKIDPRYLGPLEMGLYFLLSVCVLTVSARAAARLNEKAGAATG